MAILSGWTVALEIASVGTAFKQLPDGKDALIGYQFIECHMIFDVKLDGFRRKAHMVVEDIWQKHHLL
jgi:hypothetical protein